MCGIAGFLPGAGGDGGTLQARAEAMANAIRHRGPDDAGIWVDPNACVALAHRRLSVVDLSPAGHQPMVSGSGRFVIVFNGEIYNHQEMRASLESAGHVEPWRGHSDTETLLRAIEAWGLEETLKRSVGMFAFALWDSRTRMLHLARDRFGEKPLYYGWVGHDFLFGSELKALRAYPGFANTVCRTALAQYMRFLYVPAPLSIYRHLYKLEPGCFLTIREAAPAAPPAAPLRPGAVHGSLSVYRWWDMEEGAQRAARDPFSDVGEAIGALERQLEQSIGLQALADVPLGAFLSGGVDSSLIVALLQKQSKRPVKTFTVGFEETAFDEAPFARAVARHLGTEHNEIFVTAAESMAVIPDLPAMYDEPFADSSQIPTYLVCRAARRHVTVALSGDAGDELFGGYNRYFWGPRIWKRMKWLPYPVRRAMGQGLVGVRQSTWDALGSPLNSMFSRGRGVSRVGEKAHKLGRRMSGAHDIDSLYLNLVSEWQRPAEVVHGVGVDHAGSGWSPITGDSPSEAMMMRDSLTYLPDDILCKVDRAAMAVSLETRVPFLDHRVFEMAWRLPLAMKIRGGEGKWALRQILYKHVPRELIERPKSGFSLPLANWLRGPLRDWAENLLDARALDADGYFHGGAIRKRWAEHLTGSCDHTASLWAVLMFQSWLREQPSLGSTA